MNQVKNNNSDNFKTLPDIRFRVIAGEGVIIRQNVGEAIVVNEVGARILELLREDMSTLDLIEKMALEFDVGRDELKQDVYPYLAELESAGVVEKTSLEKDGA